MNLVDAEYGRQRPLSFRTAGIDLAEVLFENLTVEEEERCEGLILSRRTDGPFDGEVSEERFDLECA